MISKFQLGQIVCSLQGRDKGQYYIVLDKDKNRVFVVDGQTKKLDNPKKKNPAHIKATSVIITEIAKKLKNNIKINDQMIYHSIYEYKKGLKGRK